MPDLLVIVPSRGRPESVARLVQAWRDTGAYRVASLVLAVDGDDPRHGEYERQASLEALILTVPHWTPMVHKLNQVAAGYAETTTAPLLGFAGDDHIPRTNGWAQRYVGELAQMGTGIVYGDDGYQGAKLPTQWAMTADIVRALGRMVPAPVAHLYCDNAVMQLGRAAGCIRYLPDVLIEHMHPVAGKAELDDGYRRVNSRHQHDRDGTAYRSWVRDRLDRDAAAVRELRGGVTAHGRRLHHAGAGQGRAGDR